MSLVTYKEVRKLFDYKNGKLIRKITRGHAMAGDIVGSVTLDGYLTVRIGKKLYMVHRIIWMWHYGYFPENNLDHINRKKQDNRIKNLREASKQCNARNCKNLKTNTSGVKGVSWRKRNNKWAAQIVVNNKIHYIGLFVDFDEAVFARLGVEQCLNWEGCDSNSPAYKYAMKVLKG